MKYALRLLLVGLLGAASVSAQGTDDNGGPTLSPDTASVLYEADFEDGTLPPDIFLMMPEDLATVIDGVLTMTDKEFNGFWVDTTEPWIDYSVQIRMRVQDTPEIFLYSHADSFNLCSQGYSFVVSHADSYTRLETFANNDPEDCTVNVLDTLPSATILPVDSWFELRLDVQGQSAAVLLDGEEILSSDDVQEPGGTVGLFTEGPTVLEIDSIRITELETTAPDVALTDFAGGSNAAIAEMQSLGLVPAGGSRLFLEPYVFARAGSGFVPLAQRASVADVVMAGEFDVTLGDSDICGFMLRLNTQGNRATSRIYTGVLGDGSVFLVDFANPNAPGEATNSYSLPVGVDLTQTFHVLVSVVDDRASVYIDGQLILPQVPVSIRSGSFGLGMVGGNDASCEVRDVWVHQFTD